MSVTNYFRLCDRQPSAWLKSVAVSTAPCAMRPIHFSVVRLVLRKRGIAA